MSPAKKAGAKKGERDRSGALYVLLDPAMLDELDAWAERLNADNTGPQWTRTAIVRAVLSKAIKAHGAKGEAP